MKNDLTRSTTTLAASFLDNRLRVHADFTYNNANYYQTIKRVRSKYSKTEGLTETISGTQSYISETQRNNVYFVETFAIPPGAYFCEKMTRAKRVLKALFERPAGKI